MDATADTRAVTTVERNARRGWMTPLHTRDAAETFRVVEGRVTFYVDGEIIAAGAGEVVECPANAVRTVRAESDCARWVVTTRVSSAERFVDFGRAVAAPLPSSGAGWPSAEELATLAAIASTNGIELLGPPGALPGGATKSS